MHFLAASGFRGTLILRTWILCCSGNSYNGFVHGQTWQSAWSCCNGWYATPSNSGKTTWVRSQANAVAKSRYYDCGCQGNPASLLATEHKTNLTAAPVVRSDRRPCSLISWRSAVLDASGVRLPGHDCSLCAINTKLPGTMHPMFSSCFLFLLLPRYIYIYISVYTYLYCYTEYKGYVRFNIFCGTHFSGTHSCPLISVALCPWDELCFFFGMAHGAPEQASQKRRQADC